MALFNLLGGGISFGTQSRSGISALSSSKYDKSLLKYPSDLGSADKGHYILININEQINTSFPGTEQIDPLTGLKALPSVYSNRTELQSRFGVSDAVAAAKTAIDLILPDIIRKREGLNTYLNEKLDPAIGIRTIRRITDSIALYMPDTLNFNHSQSYSRLDASSAALSGLSSVIETYKNDGNKINASNQFTNAAPFLLNKFLKQFGNVGKVLFTAGTGGQVENPMMEILYSSPDFRTFRFDFLMTPRSEKEAEEVQNIINLLKFHQAPELVQNSGGLFLYPPSEFDISFQYNGSENINIPKISTCVLTSIETDYAPGGFSTYEVEGETQVSGSRLGRTGMPVAIRLGLSFTETEYLVKGSPLLPSSKKFVNTNPGKVTESAPGMGG